MAAIEPPTKILRLDLEVPPQPDGSESAQTVDDYIEELLAMHERLDEAPASMAEAREG